MIKRIILNCVFIFLLTVGQLFSQEKFDVINNWLQFTDAPNSLYHHLSQQAFTDLTARKYAVSEIKDLPELKKRQEEVKNTLMRIIGPFPDKTPLNPVITGTMKKDGYTVENIIFESRPKFYVTSSLYIPDKRTKKAPAVVYVSGHSAGGYRIPVYQHEILNLARKGFIVFAFDPVGQGERLQYYDEKEKKSVVGGPTYEHSYPGSQLFVSGTSLANYMIWDGIRAIDYLMARKEVDKDRIGITGRSGGGTQTAYIAAMDDRVFAAAPENYVTSFRRLLESIGPQDAEQNFYHGIKNGIDHADVLEVRAPKPMLMVTTTRDMFSIQGAMETAKEVSEVYKLYNASENFQRVEADTVHASAKKNREDIYTFFQKYLNNPGDSKDLDVTLLSKDELRVTKTGQVSSSMEDAETIFSLNKKELGTSLSRLKVLRSSSNYLSQVLTLSKELSGYQAPVVTGDPIFTGRYQRGSYVIEKYFVKGEGDYVLPYLLIIPAKANGRGVICLNQEGKSAELKNSETDWLISQGYTVLLPDLPGTGELGPGRFRGDSFIDNVSHGVWYLSIQIGRSIVGIQAGDVNRLVSILKKREGINSVYGMARGTMSQVMIYASAYNQNINRIFLINPLSSYRSFVSNRFYDSRLIYSTAAGALKAYDLPDLAGSLAPRRLTMVNMVNGSNKGDDNGIEEDLSIIKSSYEKKNSGNAFRTEQNDTGNLTQMLSDWGN